MHLSMFFFLAAVQTIIDSQIFVILSYLHRQYKRANQTIVKVVRRIYHDTFQPFPKNNGQLVIVTDNELSNMDEEEIRKIGRKKGILIFHINVKMHSTLMNSGQYMNSKHGTYPFFDGKWGSYL